MAPLEVNLIGARNELVPGVFRPVDLVKDCLAWFAQWFPEMYDLSGKPLFEDSRWIVADIWEKLTRNKNYLILILEGDERIQGYLIVKVKDHIGINGKPCAYVAFVAAAPWNRANREVGRKLRGIGKLLIAMAVALGFKHTRNYAIELHSLKGAEGFYQKIGMSATGRKKKDLKEFRLEKHEAMELLRFTMAHNIKKGA